MLFAFQVTHVAEERIFPAGNMRMKVQPLHSYNHLDNRIVVRFTVPLFFCISFDKIVLRIVSKLTLFSFTRS